jgi:ribosomal protein L37AE/L43A
MGRTDAWSLQLPEPLPVMPEANDMVAAPAMSGSQLAEILNRQQPQPAAFEQQAKSAISACPACSASLSGVEQKFEKCLSCGKSFAGGAGSISVSVGI